jgi:hypothetical protein
MAGGDRYGIAHRCHFISKGGYYRCVTCSGIWLPGGARAYRGC